MDLPSHLANDTLALVVAEDLEYLMRPLVMDPTRTDVRLTATVLRRLLEHGDYLKAWRQLGLEGGPQVETRVVDPCARNSMLDPMWIHYAYAGGTILNGVHHSGFNMIIIPKDKREIRGPLGLTTEASVQHSMQQTVVAQPETLSLKEFMRSTCIQIATNKISRADLLNYAANKLGGAHFDPARRKPRDQVLSRLLDHQHMFVGGLSGVYFEILSMAADLARSTDAVRFVDEVKQRLDVQPDDAYRLYFREGFEGTWNHMDVEDKGLAGARPSGGLRG